MGGRFELIMGWDRGLALWKARWIRVYSNLHNERGTVLSAIQGESG